MELLLTLRSLDLIGGGIDEHRSQQSVCLSISVRGRILGVLHRLKTFLGQGVSVVGHSVKGVQAILAAAAGSVRINTITEQLAEGFPRGLGLASDGPNEAGHGEQQRRIPTSAYQHHLYFSRVVSGLTVVVGVGPGETGAFSLAHMHATSSPCRLLVSPCLWVAPFRTSDS